MLEQSELPARLSVEDDVYLALQFQKSVRNTASFFLGLANESVVNTCRGIRSARPKRPTSLWELTNQRDLCSVCDQSDRFCSSFHANGTIPSLHLPSAGGEVWPFCRREEAAERAGRELGHQADVGGERHIRRPTSKIPFKHVDVLLDDSEPTHFAEHFISSQLVL